MTGPGNRLLSDGTFNYEYDHEGNLIKRTQIATGDYREFTWDHRNRLVAVIDKTSAGTPTQEVTFSYDAFDRRITKAVDTTPADAVDAVVTHFVYDDEDVILDFVDSDGSGPNPAQLAKRYLHGPAIDQVLAQDAGAGDVQWHLSDHLGTVRDLAEDTGIVVNHLKYDAFGNVVSQTNAAVDSRYRFGGREWNDETELGYYRARFYSSEIGRFLSEDLVRYGDGPNLYLFVLNGPIEFGDPTGKGPIAAGILGGVAGAVCEAVDAISSLSDIPELELPAQPDDGSPANSCDKIDDLIKEQNEKVERIGSFQKDLQKFDPLDGLKGHLKCTAVAGAGAVVGWFLPTP